MNSVSHISVSRQVQGSAPSAALAEQLYVFFPFVLSNTYECQFSLAKCITAASDTNGAAVTLQACTGSASQKWTFPGDSTVRVFGNKCLDVKDGLNKDGTQLQIWTCSANNANQKWWYNKWDNSLDWQGTGKCIDLPGGRLDNGNRVRGICL